MRKKEYSATELLLIKISLKFDATYHILILGKSFEALFMFLFKVTFVTALL